MSLLLEPTTLCGTTGKHVIRLEMWGRKKMLVTFTYLGRCQHLHFDNGSHLLNRCIFALEIPLPYPSLPTLGEISAWISLEVVTTPDQSRLKRGGTLSLRNIMLLLRKGQMGEIRSASLDIFCGLATSAAKNAVWGPHRQTSVSV